MIDGRYKFQRGSVILLYTSIVGLGLSLIVTPGKRVGIDTSDSSLCLEKMEQQLKISDSPSSSKKLFIVEGVDCLENSESKIDLEASEVKNLFSLRNEIVDTKKLEAEDTEKLLTTINSLQSHFDEISTYGVLKKIKDFSQGLALGGIVSGFSLFLYSYKFD